MINELLRETQSYTILSLLNKDKPIGYQQNFARYLAYLQLTENNITTTIKEYEILNCSNYEELKDDTIYIALKLNYDFKFEDLGYTIINRPLEPKSIQDLVKNYGTEKLLLQITRGISIDLYRQIMHISVNEENNSRAKVGLDFALTFWEPLIKLPRELKETILAKNDWIEELTQKIIVTKQRKILQRSVGQFISQHTSNFDRMIHNIVREKEAILASYKAIVRRERQANLLKTQDYELMAEPTLALLNRYFDMGYIRKVSQEGSGLKIFLNPLPLLFYSEHELVKTYKNLNLHEKHLEYLEKVIEGTHQMYTAPFTIFISLSIYSNTVEYEWHYVNHTTREHNRHVTIGCLGNFNVPMIDARTNLDLPKLISLIIQYIQSVTVLDAAGQHCIRYAPIVEIETQKIVYIPQQNRELNEPLSKWDNLI